MIRIGRTDLCHGGLVDVCLASWGGACACVLCPCSAWPARWPPERTVGQRLAAAASRVPLGGRLLVGFCCVSVMFSLTGVAG